MSAPLFGEEEEGGTLGVVAAQFLTANELLHVDSSAQTQETTMARGGLRSFIFDCSRWELIHYGETAAPRWAAYLKKIIKVWSDETLLQLLKPH